MSIESLDENTSNNSMKRLNRFLENGKAPAEKSGIAKLQQNKWQSLIKKST